LTQYKHYLKKERKRYFKNTEMKRLRIAIK